MSEKFTKIAITTEYITLGQLLKFANVISNGGDAKFFISENNIFVNGEFCKMRGKKLRNGDQVVINHDLFFEIENAGQ